MDNYIFKLIANPHKLNNSYNNSYEYNNKNFLIEFKKKFNKYDIDDEIYNNIIKKIENMLIENTIHKIVYSIVKEIDGEN